MTTAEHAPHVPQGHQPMQGLELLAKNAREIFFYPDLKVQKEVNDVIEWFSSSIAVEMAKMLAVQPTAPQPDCQGFPAPTANALLQKAAEHMAQRAATYDKPEGERSMGRAVQAFNAITGHTLSEPEGWLLLQVLKDVRLFQRAGYHADSAEDCIAYAALKAEAKARELPTPALPKTTRTLEATVPRETPRYANLPVKKSRFT